MYRIYVVYDGWAQEWAATLSGITIPRAYFRLKGAFKLNIPYSSILSFSFFLAPNILAAVANSASTNPIAT